MVAPRHSGGAAINQIAKLAGADLRVVPIDLDRPTGDIAVEPAMVIGEFLAGLDARIAKITEFAAKTSTLGEEANEERRRQPDLEDVGEQFPPRRHPVEVEADDRAGTGRE